MNNSKYTFVIFIFLFLTSAIIPQNDNWTLQSPPLTSQNLTCIEVIDDNIMLAFSDNGSIIKTTNGGTTWAFTSNTVGNGISGACFIDQYNGWVVGSSGSIYKTTDGGNTWAGQTSGTTKSLYAVDFVNSNIGWAVGFGRTILKTTDSGTTWTAQFTPESITFLEAVDFINENTGYAVGWGPSAQMFKTTDGGNSWNEISFSGTWLKKVYFTDELHGWAVGCQSNYISVTSDPFTGLSITVNSPKLLVWKTTDGGTTWDDFYWNVSGYLRGVNFIDNSNGMFVGDNGTIITTNDGANTFNFVNSSSISSVQLNDIEYFNSTSGCIVGNFGYIYKTTDSGISWLTQNGNGTTKNINSCFFFNADLGFAACDNGAVLKTTNGGLIWLSQTAGGTSYDDWYSIFFTDEQHGFVAGATGKYRYTTNGGAVWRDKYISNSWTINGLWFPSASKGFAVGEYGTILKTTDSGNNWNKISGIPQKTLNSIHFINENEGWISGTGTILKTSDGGETWTEIPLTNYQYTFFCSIFFIDSNNGWMCANDGLLFKSTDGGQSWTEYYSGTQEDLNNIYFVNSNVGWVTGTNGIILKTINGGVNWGELKTDIEYPVSQYSSYWGGFNTVKFVDENTGWLMGSNGYIIKSTNGGGNAYYWPNLLSPSNESTDNPLTPTLTWEAIPGASSYELQYSNFSYFSYATTIDGLTQPSYLMNTLDNNKTYYWKVRTNYGSEKSLWSQVYSFKTLPQHINAPATPEIYYPDFDEDLCTVTINFSWSKVSQATDYHLQIATDWEFNSIIRDIYNIPTSPWIEGTEVSNLDYNTTYYFRLRAHNSYGYSAFTNLRKFNTETRDWHAYKHNEWNDLNGMYFLNENVGFVLDSYRIQKITYGGIYWTEIYPHPSGIYDQLKDITFIDNLSGWTVGVGGRIYKTTDGGTNWGPQVSGISNTITSVNFINSLEGWCLSNHKLLKTTDGGTIWQIINIPGTLSINSINFLDNLHGWAFGYKMIYKTSDGGLNWSSIELEGTFVKSFFISSATAWAVGENGYLVKTTNGGNSWFYQQSGVNNNLYDVYFFNEQMGIAVGSKGTIVKTTDGGSTWIKAESGASENRIFCSIKFISDRIGWILGSRVLLKTNNGGGLTPTGPGIPVLASPPNNAVNMPLYIEYVWNHTTNSPEYNLEISTDSTFISWASRFTLSDTTTTISATPGTKYYWRVRGVNGDALGDWSEVWNFTVQDFCKDIILLNGWNIVSIPVSLNDLSLAPIFSDAISQFFGYNNGYVTATAYEQGKGYWLKYPNPDTITLCGYKLAGDISLSEGWNIVGIFDNNYLVTNLVTIPSGIITSSFYGYNNGYVTATTLESGKGYWVKTNQAGYIVYPALQKNKTINNLEITINKEWPRIELTDANNRKGILYLTNSGKELNKYELPPLPPKGIFDFRFSSDRLVETLNSESKEIKISSAEYPVKLKIVGTDIKISDLLGGKIINVLLKDGETITINNSAIEVLRIEGKSVPAEFALYQNYPNPFNPVTKIKYALPVDSKVCIAVYNLLGEKIREIVNQNVSAGYNEIEFNASDLSSGMYLYRIEANAIAVKDHFISVKKMLVIK